jgi:ABC-2 type transport system permease protein
MKFIEFAVNRRVTISMLYALVLLLGLIGTIMQQVTLLTVALGLSKEWEQKTSTSLREITHSPLMALAGKFLAYYTMMLPVCLISLAIPFKVFGALNTGSALLLAGITAFFLVLLCFAGIAISGLTRDSLYTTQMLMIVAVPSFILSGYTWPAFAMPKFLQYLSSALPLTHYLVMVRKITMMGCGITYFQKPLEALAVWTVVSILGAYAATTRLIRQG